MSYSNITETFFPIHTKQANVGAGCNNPTIPLDPVPGNPAQVICVCTSLKNTSLWHCIACSLPVQTK